MPTKKKGGGRGRDNHTDALGSGLVRQANLPVITRARPVGPARRLVPGHMRRNVSVVSCRTTPASIRPLPILERGCSRVKTHRGGGPSRGTVATFWHQSLSAVAERNPVGTWVGTTRDVAMEPNKTDDEGGTREEPCNSRGSLVVFDPNY